MSITKWTLLLAGSAAAGLVVPATAWAAADNLQESGDGASGTEDASSSGVADIVVTANRREERLQEVPVTVTVVDAGQMARQNINSTEGLVRAAPALNLAGPSGFGALSIRGIGSLNFSRSSEGSVGVVVDGVALANTSTNPPLLFDIARVEVLEGPQGMLFGRNASAGVLNITTRAPDPSQIEAIFHAEIASRENYVAQGALNLPVGGNAALRVAGSFNQDPRIQHNRFDDSWMQQRTVAARARFLWEPSDTVSINLAGDYTDRDNEGGTPWAVYSTTPGSKLAQRLADCGVVVGPENTEGCVNDGLRSSNTTYGFSGQVDVDLGGVTLTSITAHRAIDTGSSTDVDSVPINRYVQTVADEARNFSQELRLSSPSGGFIEYVAGLYYFMGKSHNRTGQLGRLLADTTPLVVPVGQYRETDIRTESYAAFGQATINATDDLRFILGGRWGREEVTADTTAAALEPGSFRIIAPAPAISARARDTYFIYRLGAQYDLSSDLMVFATYARGYKGPAINDGATSLSLPLIVQPEKPQTGEIGFKATLAGGRAALNASAFYTKVTDFQAQFWDPTANGSSGAFIFGNAPSLTVKGVTANLFGRPVKGLTTNVGVTYTDGSYGAGYEVNNAYNQLVDTKGNQFGTKWKVTASAEYTAGLSSDMDGFVQADMVYRSRVFSNAANDPILAIEGAAIFGGRIGVRTSDERLGASIFVRNLFNTFRPTTRYATPTAAQQLDPASFSQFSGPEAHRRIGVSLDVRF